MNLSLTDELEAWISERVKSGLYRSSSEVVREALRLLKEQEELKALRRDELKAMIRQGIDDLDAGRSRSLDADVIADLKEFEETMPAEARGKVDEALTALKEAIESGGVEGIKSATEALEQVWYQASSELYQQAGAAAGEDAQDDPTADASTDAAEEEVIDADFEVVDDEKKDQ